MKFRKPLLSTLTVGALIFGSTLLAQDMPSAPPAATAPDASMNNAAPVPAPQAQVTVQSARAPAPSIGSPPSFEQLSGGSNAITADQASAYPPLANDFLNASHNGPRVSRSQYAEWVKQVQ